MIYRDIKSLTVKDTGTLSEVDITITSLKNPRALYDKYALALSFHNDLPLVLSHQASQYLKQMNCEDVDVFDLFDLLSNLSNDLLFTSMLDNPTLPLTFVEKIINKTTDTVVRRAYLNRHVIKFTQSREVLQHCLISYPKIVTVEAVKSNPYADESLLMELFARSADPSLLIDNRITEKTIIEFATKNFPLWDVINEEKNLKLLAGNYTTMMGVLRNPHLPPEIFLDILKLVVNNNYYRAAAKEVGLPYEIREKTVELVLDKRIAL